MKKFKKLSVKSKVAIENEVKLLFAAHRNCLWTRWNTFSHSQAVDPTKWQSVCNEGYYGEAFGVMRGLVAMGYGYFGPDTIDAVQDDRSDVPEHNVKWWFDRICRSFLDEEGFFDKTCTSDKCEELLNKYRKLVRK